MDSKLRTRLIGAAVLIGLAVIFVPMFLDSDRLPDPGSQEVSLEIPPEDGGPLPTRVLPADPEAPLPQVSAADPDVVTTVDTATAPPPMTATQGEIQRDQQPVPVPAVVPKPTPSVETKPLEPTPKPLPSASAGGRFAVNFGSYGSQANAEKLLAQLKGLRVSAAVEAVTVNEKPLWRVIARGYGSRSAAETVRLSAQAGISGLAATIVQGNLASPTAPATQVPSSLSAWAVQIGVYSDTTKANALVAELKAQGFAAFAERVITPQGSTLRVRVGPELKRAGADKLKTEIKAKLGLDGFVVSHP